jgi:serine/threonine-protein kinase
MSQLDDPNALVGAVLNRRLRLTGVLGQGGLAVVYSAEGLAGEGVCAVKLLRSEFCSEPGVVERFLGEATAAARVKHPGLAAIYEAQRAEDGSPYLVMELLSGQPLAARMNRGRLPLDEAAPIVHEMLAALGALHAAGIVHRDLKPDNVFLARDPAGRQLVKLLDFGLAKVIDAAGGTNRKTRTGMLLGTPGYMSPEQVKNPKQVDQRTDLWATGILLYEMLSGVPAFNAENDFARVTAVLYGDPAPIEQVAPQHAGLSDFFRRALAREPTERFQSAGEMADALVLSARTALGAASAPATDRTIPIAPTAMFAAAPPMSTTLPAPGAFTAPAAATPSGAPHVFGSVHTAISAEPSPGLAPSTPAAPLVQVVTPPRTGVPVILVILLVSFALGAGFVVGLLVARG